MFINQQERVQEWQEEIGTVLITTVKHIGECRCYKQAADKTSCSGCYRLGIYK